jgi:hypothetical protein
MLIATRHRRSHARFSAALAVAAALVIALIGVPATASASTMGVPNASGTVAPASPFIANGGTYRWANANSGLCLAYDPESRGFARQEGCDNDNTVSWAAVNTSSNSNNYGLINKHNLGTCLTIYGAPGTDGSPAFIYQCGYAGTATPDQIFTLVPAPANFPGYYELVNLSSGKCVAVGGASTNLGAWVIQWTCGTTGEFMWRPFI